MEKLLLPHRMLLFFSVVLSFVVFGLSATNTTCRMVRSNRYTPYYIQVYDCRNKGFKSVPNLTDVYRRSGTIFVDLSDNLIETIKPSDFSYGNPSNLVLLDLRGNPIKQIESYSFSALKNLKELYLTADSIDAFALTSLDRLEKLVINGSSSLATLPIQLFQPLKKVTNITIQHTGIKTLKQHIFANLDNLLIVNLRFNRLQSINKELFAKNGNIADINLSWNELESVGDILHSENNHVLFYNLSNNKISTIDSNALVKMQFLEILDISHNRLTQLPINLFDTPVKLKQLYLQENQFVSFSRILTNAKELKHLDLSKNNFTKFTGEDLPTSGSTLTSLMTLNLRGNAQLSTVNFSSSMINTNLAMELSENCQLRNLNFGTNPFGGKVAMRGCCLQNVPQEILSGSFQVLDLSDNNITSLELQSSLAVSLFNLSHNQIREIRKSTSSDIRFIHLDLSFNNLTNVPSIENILLKKLTLNNNNLKTLNYRPKYDRLVYLDLAYNQLRDLSNHSFGFYTHLEELILSGNQISYISNRTFMSEINLKKLNLNENDITEINQQGLIGLKLLEELSVVGNKLTSLSNQFDHLQKLKMLDLSGNPISIIANGALSQLANLQSVNMRHTNLREVPGDFLERLRLPKLKSVDLSHNDFPCTCNLTLTVYQMNTFKVVGTCIKSNGSRLALSFFKSNVSELSTTNCNLCSLSPCNFRGNCVADTRKGFLCKCEHGFLGRNCEISAADCYKTQICGLCNSSICNQGKCKELSPIKYECQCPRNATGSNCETPIYDCSVNRCKNGGSCIISASGNYSCVCFGNSFGHNCEFQEYCQQTTCFNNGVCRSDNKTGFTCDCKRGYSGERCDQTDSRNTGGKNVVMLANMFLFLFVSVLFVF